MSSTGTIAPDQDFYVRDWTDDATHGDNGVEPSTHPVFYKRAMSGIAAALRRELLSMINPTIVTPATGREISGTIGLSCDSGVTRAARRAL
jgi:hypothetical protein